MRVLGGTLIALALLVGCDAATPGDPPPASSNRVVELGGEAVARVGASTISAESVRRIADNQAVMPEEARRRAVLDALLAEEARARGIETRHAETTALARALMGVLREEVRGPVSDEELERVTKRHWLELRRPEGFRVVHAVVRVPSDSKTTDDATWAEIDAVAKAIHAAADQATQRARTTPGVDGEKDPAATELERIAAAVSARGFEIKVEALGPIASDGRSLVRGTGGLLPDFAAKVAALRERGDRTAPFRTPYGTHVALLLERLEPHEVPEAERRALVAGEVLDERIAAARAALRTAHAHEVVFPPNAGALLDLVRVQ